MLTYSDEITVEEYNDLRRSVNWITVKDKRAQKALTNSFYKLIARKDGSRLAWRESSVTEATPISLPM